jgi:hypothetical protein
VRGCVLSCECGVLFREVLEQPRRIALCVLSTSEATKYRLGAYRSLELGHESTTKNASVTKNSRLPREVRTVERHNVRVHDSGFAVLRRNAREVFDRIEEKECTIKLLCLELVSPEGLREII